MGSLRVLREAAPFLSLYPDTSEPFHISSLAEWHLGVTFLFICLLAIPPSGYPRLFPVFIHTLCRRFRIYYFAQIVLSLYPVKCTAGAKPVSLAIYLQDKFV